jgi:hypothetical protein
MGVLKRIFLARDEWWRLVPDQSVLAAGGATDGNLLRLAARHAEGRWLMVYLAERASFSIHMDRVKAAQANAFWIDPRTGDSQPIGAVAATGVKAFSTPDGWEDALLILEAADNRAS